MEKIWPFSPGVEAMIVAVGGLYILLGLLPLLYPGYISFRARPVLPRRLLFVGVVAALSYGVETFLLVAITVPLGAYAVFIAPPLESSGYSYARWLVFVARFIRAWGWLLLPILPAIASVVLTRYLMNRWPRITESLHR